MHLNELLATKINDLPEEMIATFKLFLADPASFSRQVISNAKVGRNKRSSDDCNIDYSSESVGLDVKITCVDPKIPLKVGITVFFLFSFLIVNMFMRFLRDVNLEGLK